MKLSNLQQQLPLCVYFATIDKILLNSSKTQRRVHIALQLDLVMYTQF